MVTTDREDEISSILRRIEPVTKSETTHQMTLWDENERRRCESCLATITRNPLAALSGITMGELKPARASFSIRR